MKFTKITFVAIFFLLPFSNFAQHAVNFQNGYTTVFFSHQLNFDDLSKMKKELSEKGINLSYDYLKFTKDGKLSGIEYHVTSGKVSAADKSEDLDKEIGFIINNDPKGKYGIIAGEKESILKMRIEKEKKN